MRALVLHGPGDYRLEEDWPEPAPRPGWATIRVQHAGVCGSDLPRFGTTGSYHHPMILGHEFAGVVETPAPHSKRFRGGEQVAVLPIIPCGDCWACDEHEPFHCKDYQFLGSRNDGGFAELCLVPENNLFELPEGVAPRLGALIEPLAVALHTVRRSGYSGSGSALVMGAGPLGLLIGLWLKMLGADRVAVADVREASLDVARRMGFEETVHLADDNWTGKGGSFDFVFEAAGAQAALLHALELARDKGTITVLGRSTTDTVIPHENFEKFMRKELRLIGCWGYRFDGEEPVVRQALADRRFHLDPLITHEVSLAESPGIIREMIDKSIYYCKVMINI